MDDKCFYCGDTGYIHKKDDIEPDQMCSYCEIGQAVIKGYNAARELGVQACDTLEAAKNERIKELERRLLEHLKGHSLEAICDECSIHYWYVDDETIICPYCFPKQALKGGE